MREGERNKERESCSLEHYVQLSAPKSQQSGALYVCNLAHRNRSDFAICDCDAIADPRNRAISETRESNAALRFKGAMESR